MNKKPVSAKFNLLGIVVGLIALAAILWGLNKVVETRGMAAGAKNECSRDADCKAKTGCSKAYCAKSKGSMKCLGGNSCPKPTVRPKKPTTGCCSDRDCNPTCAHPDCMIYKCNNAVLCKSGGNGRGTCK